MKNRFIYFVVYLAGLMVISFPVFADGTTVIDVSRLSGRYPACYE